jgi:hypothetical protein
MIMVLAPDKRAKAAWEKAKAEAEQTAGEPAAVEEGGDAA